MIPQKMLEHLNKCLSEVGVHCREGSPPTSHMCYAMALTAKMRYISITQKEDAPPTIFVINEQQIAALVEGIFDLPLAIATACALTYGWVDPEV